RLSEKERRNLGILDSIRRSKEISRAEISKITDLNIVTVSNYVNKYLKHKIVLETGLDISTGGRRPELLQLNRQYAYSIGIDLGPPQITFDSSVVAVLMDISGQILAKEKFKKEKESFENLTEKVVELTEVLIRKSGVSKTDIKGIGIGIWGVIDRYRNMVRYPVEEEQIISYANLLKELEDKFAVPVLIEHDATLAAFGERWTGIGAANTAENLIFLCADSSCGLIIKGEVYYGATKSAGELNLNPPYFEQKQKPENCWESYEYGCCLRSRGINLGILRRIKERLIEGEEASLILDMTHNDLENLNMELIVDAAEKGDEVAKQELENAGKYLGVKIAFLVNLFNPEMIVVGRGMEKAGNIFFSMLRKTVRKWGYEESIKVIKILPTSLGEDVVAAGAGALVIQNIFSGI
ncbi:MAG: ROK family protein, partial [Candidatus Omnitrophica bacterium]|nr:ROK family protein [Candidatus Omnitrophota bacterium]